MSHQPAATTETNGNTRQVFPLFRSSCTSAPATSRPCAADIRAGCKRCLQSAGKSEGSPTLCEQCGGQILLKPEPDAYAGPTLRHPAISGQRGGRPVKMSTGPAVNPSGCSVISGGARSVYGGRSKSGNIVDEAQTFTGCKNTSACFWAAVCLFVCWRCESLAAWWPAVVSGRRHSPACQTADTAVHLLQCDRQARTLVELC